MPGSYGWPNNSMNQLKLISRWNFINVLIIVTQDVPAGGDAAEPEKERISSQHKSREQKQTGHFDRYSHEREVDEYEIPQTRKQQPQSVQFWTVEQDHNLVVIGVIVQHDFFLHLDDVDVLPYHANTHIREYPQAQVKTIPVYVR